MNRPVPSRRASCLLISLLALVVCGYHAKAGDVKVLANLDYRQSSGSTEYEQERCKLDLYLPAGTNQFATLLWFHGGGLENGTKDEPFTRDIARSLAQSGVAVAAANYRLSPKVKFPAYVEDAAAAFAWVRSQIPQHGGDASRVFIGGHSAGGYLTLMVGMDPQFLAARGLKLSDIAGLIPVSGQTMTHYTVRTERGLPKSVILADAAAPVHHATQDLPPMLLLYADKDLPARLEENTYLAAALKAAGHKQVSQQLITNRDHGTVAKFIKDEGDPARAALLAFIESVKSQKP